MDIEKKVSREIIYLEENKYIYSFFKRLSDIFLSIIGIILLLPFFLLISLLIKIDGPKGNIFFYQNRVGFKGEIFKIYKFRSMYPDAEQRLEEVQHLNEIKGNMFKVKEDPRITKIGKFIRAYSIDELPQLVNVLKGDMSLVGPRPPLVKEVENYTEYDKKRLSIKPGITGLWQVSGRNSLDFAQMVDLDLKYIRTLSFKNDFLILLKTILVVLKRDNAY